MTTARSALSLGVEILAARHEAERTPGYDIVVVGSGYGGAVAAARLSGMRARGAPTNFTVCVLERGKEYSPGHFPANWAELIGHLRISGPAMANQPGFPEGLFDFKTGGDVTVLVASGVGGGSLINAGVCERAEDAVFLNDAWPDPWRSNTARWKRLYERAELRLGATRWPRHRLNKQLAMQDLARLGGAQGERPIHLTIVPPVNDQTSAATLPPTLTPCIECGDCFTGCNVGAKITLSHNYLKQAYEQGAEIFTGATVRSVEPLPSNDPRRLQHGWRWRVRYALTNGSKLPGGVAEYDVLAKHVVVSAGTFGSTEILLRSRTRGLSVSGRLGEGFSGNGDVVTALYDGPTQANACPDDAKPLAERKAGPTITSQISWRPAKGSPWRRLTMQELTVPSSLGWVFQELITTMLVPERWTHVHWRNIRKDSPEPYAPDHAAFQRTLLTVTYVDDGAMGRLEPTVGFDNLTKDGGLVVRWKDLGKLPALQTIDGDLQRVAKRYGATYFRNPLYQFMPQANFLGLAQTNKQTLSVHPLGGCRMADNANEGVTDPYGRVYNPNVDLDDPTCGEALRLRLTGLTDKATHEGLYVLDGSLMPCALGINPLLTITAVAEGAIDDWVQQNGWQAHPVTARELHPHTRPMGLPATAEQPTSVRFSERMAGKLHPFPQLPPCHLSMRVHFAGVDDLAAFIQTPGRSSGLKATFRVTHAPDENPFRLPMPTVQQSGSRSMKLKGTVQWLAPEPSHVLQRLYRSVRTYLRQRYAADQAESKHRKRPMLEGVLSKLIGGTHFGAVRQLAYTFDPLHTDWPLGRHPERPSETVGLPKGTVLYGTKRVGYVHTDPSDPDSANPWHQLIHLKLRARLPPGPNRFTAADGSLMHRLTSDDDIELGVLVFDELAMMDRYTVPLTITGQHNGLTALRDLMRLGLFFGRTLFGLHMLSFRRPEYPVELLGHRPRNRLPSLDYGSDDARYAGLTIERHTVSLPLPAGTSSVAAPIQLLLTRFKPPRVQVAEPVMLIHGFGSGGIQFTHAAINQPMAPWLAQRGADVWVVELRTSIGLPTTSHQQWVMDEVAQQDIPALVNEVLRLTGSNQVNVIAHCIGSAMFCMATLAGRLEGKVARASLMQVGPHAELPRASRARGYLGGRLQQLLGMFEADSVASQHLDDMQVMVDRLMGTYLYPLDQRPHYRLSSDLNHNMRLVSANRSTNIFGQLFQWENMTPDVMDAIEDLLGHCNLTTYGQTTQFVYNRRVMDLAGNDRYMKPEHVRRYFSFPTLLVHGEANQTFSPRTLTRNTQLLETAGTAVSTCKVPGYGHLDCVVGKDVATLVYPALLGHLKEAKAVMPGSPANKPSDAELRLPEVGPWLGHLSPLNEPPSQPRVQLRLGLRVEDLGRAFLGVAVTICRNGTPLHAYPQCWSADNWPTHEGILDVQVPTHWLTPDHTLEVLVAAVHHQWPTDSAHMRRLVMRKYRQLKHACLERGVPLRAIEGLRLSTNWMWRQMAHTGELQLALGACRQRPLVVDRDMADRSMHHLARQIKADALDALILCGDQIYADSRVDSTHPAATEALLLDAHREAWTSPHQRDVMRRIATYMVQDDHEYRNDYNMALAASRPIEYRHARDIARQYQLAAGPAGTLADTSNPQWYTLSCRGVPIFMADVRSERLDPPTIDRQAARIMSPQQMDALQQWLCETPQHGKTRLVVTSVPVAPLFTHALADPSYGVRSDGWERFPQSLAQLLGWIAQHNIQNVVFLSGDYHHSADVRIEVQHRQQAIVQIRSIVTGGLYSPYPFANARPQDWLDPQGEWLSLDRDTRWTYHIDRATPGNGYTQVDVDANGQVRARFKVCR